MASQRSLGGRRQPGAAHEDVKSFLMGLGGRMEAQTIASEVGWFPRLARASGPDSHRVNQGRLGHAAAVIQNRNLGVRPRPLEVQPDVTGTGGDAVVDEVRYRIRK